MHGPVLLSHKPSLFARAIGPIGRLGLDIQKKIAGIFGFKSANKFAITTTAVGVGVLALSPFFGPFAALAYKAGVVTAGAGVVDLAGNAALKKIADSDGKS